MPTQRPRTRLALSPEGEAVIDTRSEPIPGGPNRSDTADRILRRYDDLMVRGRRDLPGKFNNQELALLLDVLGQTPQTADGIEHMDLAVADAMPEYAGIHGVADPKGFLRTIRNLSPLERYAIADALERFSASAARGEEPEIRTIWK